jgi:hypothetical protein
VRLPRCGYDVWSDLLETGGKAHERGFHILSYAASTKLKTAAQRIDLVHRLYNIALYDNHVPEEHRKIALRLAEALTADIEKALSGNPDALAALRKANNHMIENARLHGVGSLSWKIMEESISEADILPYVMRPEHRHLVPVYLEAIGEKTVSEFRKELVRQLVLADLTNKTQHEPFFVTVSR